MVKEFIDITPHRSIMCKISQTGYSVQEAISELIDNSIDARLENEKLTIRVIINKEHIIIEDTGKGMNKLQAKDSIRLGYSSKKEKLGEFGLGLKTATSFLGEEFVLKTKMEDSNEEYIIKYDENEWLQKGDWFKFPFIIEEKNDKSHGTVVEVKKLKIDLTAELLQKIKEELGRGRLVTVFDKIGLTNNQEIKQIIGELEISGVDITHDKKDWVKTSDEYKQVEEKLMEYFKEYEYKPKRLLTGYPASKGKVIGTVRQVNMFHSGNMEQEIKKVNKGDIIVTAMTRPQYLIAIRRAGGIVTDLGGTLCHAAIVSREFGIPAVVGTNIATSVLQDGQKVIIDGGEGVVYEY